MKRNIFENLIKDENSFTEGFVTLLTLHEEFRKNFINTLNKKFSKTRFEADFFKNISTQSQNLNERPDIVIENDKKILLIEIKTENNTILQESQKNGYKEYLSSIRDKEKLILFIIPKLYKHTSEINYPYIFWENIIKECINPITKDTSLQRDYQKVLVDYTELLKEKLNYTEIIFNEKEITAMKNTENINVSIKLMNLFNKISKWEENKYEIRNSWFEIYENSVAVWLRAYTENPVMGFILNHNENGSGIEDHLEIKTYWKKIPEKLLNKHKIKQGNEIEEGNSYVFEKGLIISNEDFGEKIINIINDILEDQLSNEKND